MAFDENGRKFSWHDVRIIEKADSCYFRVPGLIQDLQVPYQQTEFDTFYEAEKELELLRKEEDAYENNTVPCAACNYAEGTESIYGTLYCTSCANM